MQLNCTPSESLKLYAEKGEPRRYPFDTVFDTKAKVEGARQSAKLLATFSLLIKSSEKEDGTPPRKRMRRSEAEQVPNDTSQEDNEKPAARPDDKVPVENVSNDNFLDESNRDEAHSNARNISDDEANSVVRNVPGDEPEAADAGNDVNEEGSAGDKSEEADASKNISGVDIAGDEAKKSNASNDADREVVAYDEAGESDARNDADREVIAGDEAEEADTEGAGAGNDASREGIAGDSAGGAAAAAAAGGIARDETEGADTYAENEAGGDDIDGDKKEGGADADADAAAGGAIEDFIGWKVAKHFGDEVFKGTITEKRGDDLWFVVYEDEDEEEFEVEEVIKYNKLYMELYS